MREGVRSRAAFRALRETVGMTQQALADELGVQVRSVKRWEAASPNGWYEPPDEAWEVLEAARDVQRIAVETAIERVEATESEHGGLRMVVLRYWLCEGDYLSWSTDAELGVVGDWRMANANARAAAIALEALGYGVSFADGNPTREQSRAADVR